MSKSAASFRLLQFFMFFLTMTRLASASNKIYLNETYSLVFDFSCGESNTDPLSMATYKDIIVVGNPNTNTLSILNFTQLPAGSRFLTECGNTDYSVKIVSDDDGEGFPMGVGIDVNDVGDLNVIVGNLFTDITVFPLKQLNWSTTYYGNFDDHYGTDDITDSFALHRAPSERITMTTLNGVHYQEFATPIGYDSGRVILTRGFLNDVSEIKDFGYMEGLTYANTTIFNETSVDKLILQGSGDDCQLGKSGALFTYNQSDYYATTCDGVGFFVLNMSYPGIFRPTDSLTISVDGSYDYLYKMYPDDTNDGVFGPVTFCPKNNLGLVVASGDSGFVYSLPFNSIFNPRIIYQAAQVRFVGPSGYASSVLCGIGTDGNNTVDLLTGTDGKETYIFPKHDSNVEFYADSKVVTLFNTREGEQQLGTMTNNNVTYLLIYDEGRLRVIPLPFATTNDTFFGTNAPTPSPASDEAGVFDLESLTTSKGIGIASGAGVLLLLLTGYSISRCIASGRKTHDEKPKETKKETELPSTPSSVVINIPSSPQKELDDKPKSPKRKKKKKRKVEAPKEEEGVLDGLTNSVLSFFGNSETTTPTPTTKPSLRA